MKTRPLTPDRWDEFRSAFGERGACGGGWSMAPRLTRSDGESVWPIVCLFVAREHRRQGVSVA